MEQKYKKETKKTCLLCYGGGIVELKDKMEE